MLSKVSILISKNCIGLRQSDFFVFQAFTIVATEPVESMVPIVSEIQRLRCMYNPRKLLGCVELNCVRANTVLADFLRVPPESVRVPVIGGATQKTMVPVLSAAVHPCTLSQEQVGSVELCMCLVDRWKLGTKVVGRTEKRSVGRLSGCPFMVPVLSAAAHPCTLSQEQVDLV